MADFVEVIRKAVLGLTDNTIEMRARVYEKARGAVRRQLEEMKPRPPETMFARQFNRLDAAIVQIEREMTLIEEAIEGFDPMTPDEAEKIQPVAPSPGLSFELGADGLLKIARTGQPTSEDYERIGHLRTAVSVAVSDLIALSAGSNSYSHIGAIAERYRAAIGYGSDVEMSVDLLYAEGIRLENARKKLESMDDRDALPGSMPVLEALDSVIALNGPMVMSTNRGRELVEMANAYDYDPTFAKVLRDLLVDFSDELIASGRVLRRDDAFELAELNDEVGFGQNPKRSTALAHTANHNLLAVAATCVTFGVSQIVGQALLESQSGFALTRELTTFIDHAVPFFIGKRELLFNLANSVGHDFAWVASFLRWLELQQAAFDIRRNDV